MIDDVTAGVPAAPAAPLVAADELWFDTPFLLFDGGRYTIGWQRWPDRKGGPGFAVLRRGSLDVLKVVERYPLTDQGWAAAWQSLVKLDPDTAGKIQVVLDERINRDRLAAELSRLDASSLGYLPDVTFLGGYIPSTELVEGTRYDLRFLADRCGAFPVQGVDPLTVHRYGDVLAVEIGGPGLVQKYSYGVQALMSAEFGLAGALIAYGTTTIKTLVRIQARDSELFFLHQRNTPDDLRIQLSRALGVIRATQAEAVPSPGSIADELSRLAALADRGVLTREEFDRLKAKLIAER